MTNQPFTIDTIKEMLSIRGQEFQGNITIAVKENSIIIQDVKNSDIKITQDINSINEEHFLQEIVQKIIHCFPLIPTKIPKELNTIRIALPRKIVGRLEEVQKIMKLLNQDNSLLLVSGIGGIGKTVVSSYYYSLFSQLYQHILWLDGSKNLENELLFDFHLHESLGISERLLPYLSVIQDPKKTIEKQRALAIIETSLKKLNHKTLFIIDNSVAENFAVIQKWQSTLREFHFLITSRETNTNLNIFKLGVLSPKSALDLFYVHYHLEKDDTIVSSILEQIHYHTLLIELVAKAGDEGKVSLKELLEFLLTGYIEHEGLQYQIDINEIIEERIPEEERIVCYIQLLFNTILKLNADEQLVLSSLSVLPTAPHEKDLLLQIFKNTQSTLSNIILNPMKIINILNTLFKKGYLQRDKGIYILHALVASATRGHINPNIKELEDLVTNIGSLLHINQEKDNPVHKFPYISYGVSLIDYLPKDGIEEYISPYTHLQNGIGLIYQELGAYKNAKRYIESCIHLYHEYYPTTHQVEIAVLQSNLGNIYRNLAEYDLAKGLLEKAIEFYKENFGEEHPYLSTFYSNLALVYKSTGFYHKSLELLEKAVALDIHHLGEKHPETNIKASNLAMVYSDLAEYKKAITLLNTALENDINNFNIEHPNVARIQSNLGFLYCEVGDYAVATSFLQASLNNYTRDFNENHPYLSSLQTNLALLYRELGEYTKSISLLEKVLKNEILNFGVQHPKVAQSQSNLAMMYRRIGKNKQAVDLLEKALESDIQYLGIQHPETAKKQSNLATIYYDLEDFSKAIRLLEQALITDIKTLGKSHPNIAIRQSNLATIYLKLSKFAEAIDLLQKSLNINIQYYGKMHPQVALNQSNLAAVYQTTGVNDKAIQLLESALNIDLSKLGAQHPAVANSYNNLACIYLSEKEYHKAVDYFQNAYNIFFERLGEQHPNTQTVKQGLILAQSKIKKS